MALPIDPIGRSSVPGRIPGLLSPPGSLLEIQSGLQSLNIGRIDLEYDEKKYLWTIYINSLPVVCIDKGMTIVSGTDGKIKFKIWDRATDTILPPEECVKKIVDLGLPPLARLINKLTKTDASVHWDTSGNSINFTDEKHPMHGSGSLILRGGKLSGFVDLEDLNKDAFNVVSYRIAKYAVEKSKALAQKDIFYSTNINLMAPTAKIDTFSIHYCRKEVLRFNKEKLSLVRLNDSSTYQIIDLGQGKITSTTKLAEYLTSVLDGTADNNPPLP